MFDGLSRDRLERYIFSLTDETYSLVAAREDLTGAECFRMGAWMLDEARRWLSGEPLRYEVTEKMLATMA